MAVVLLAIAIPPVFLGGPWFFGLVLVAAALGWWEFAGMGRAAGLRPFFLVGGAATLGVCALSAAPPPWRDLALAVALGATSVAMLARPDYRGALADVAHSLLGVVWIGWLAGFALSLRLGGGGGAAGVGPDAAGLRWLLTAVAVTIASDTGAYATGRAVGRRPLCPRVSPKKTVEGLMGGLLAAALVGLAAAVLALHIPAWQGALVGLVGGGAAVLGDLAESLLKRQVGVKDSSRLIPGHGGLLDRMDSLLFAIPAVYACVMLIGGG